MASARAINMSALTRAGPLASHGAIASRAFSTASRTPAMRSAARPSMALKLNNTGRIAFRRAYADEAPKPKAGKIRRTLRWTWRLTYLSFAGLLGYTGYIIWEDRHPEPQYEADPTKKTLVVLGKLPILA